MFGLFKKMFGANSLCEIGKSGNAEEFAQQFINSEITLLALPVPDSVDPASLTREELLALIEKAAQEMSKQTSVTLFTYDEESESVLPVFTDERAAETFVRQYVTEKNLVIPFEVLTMKGGALGGYISHDAVIKLNAKSDSEYRLSKKDIVLIRQSGA